ncbi:unnamed protein product [Kuraishia capsulata CBS 1993]|uniref:Large ribosomal subunit protein mL44 n=1 Tax=Kuraishia capsulata CBS 1993 TaxID=1382522 RepID=W6MWE6_9ASCO|nr:uncharacterized protein KUCA_T00003288001 [Kuraishia capsulata CBS 1993]CDK27310.1 unnamed protein product [Kuraishia capsulata CBS 1993]
MASHRGMVRVIPRTSVRFFKTLTEPYSPTISTDLYTQEKEPRFISLFQNDSRLKTITEEEAKLSPSLIALHARLNLGQDFPLATLARALTCDTKDGQHASNSSLSQVGKRLVKYHVTENMITKYPRLPIAVFSKAVNAYVGTESLSSVGRLFGIEVESKSPIDKYLSGETLETSFGKLRFDSAISKPESGVKHYGKEGITEDVAYKFAVRSIIGGVYLHKGESAAKKFIDEYILSRKVDVESMLKFEQPQRMLLRLLRRNNLPAPVSKLMAETGRHSVAPVYVVGVFSGDSLLGEGQGSSIREATMRGAVNALKAHYLYRPLNERVPSDPERKEPLYVDEGEVYF